MRACRSWKARPTLGVERDWLLINEGGRVAVSEVELTRALPGVPCSPGSP